MLQFVCTLGYSTTFQFGMLFYSKLPVSQDIEHTTRGLIKCDEYALIGVGSTWSPPVLLHLHSTIMYNRPATCEYKKDMDANVCLPRDTSPLHHPSILTLSLLII